MGFRSTEESILLVSWDLQLPWHLSDPSLSKSKVIWFQMPLAN